MRILRPVQVGFTGLPEVLMVRTTRFSSLSATRLAACAATALAASVLPVFTQTHGPATPATGNRAIAPPGPLGLLSPRTGLLLRDDVVIQLIQQSSGDRARDHVALLTQ